MAEAQYEALSALMDGELDPDQADAVLDALCRDDALAAEWRRMHQIRGLLRDGAEQTFDISAAVREAIADDPNYLLPAIAPARATTHWLRYAVGGALAASVALATVIGLRQWQAPGATGQLAAQTSGAITGPIVATGLASGEVRGPVAAHQPSRLDAYWAAHADNALLAGQDSMTPLLRDVSIDSPP